MALALSVLSPAALVAILGVEGGDLAPRLFSLAVFASLAALVYAASGRVLFSVVLGATVPLLIFTISRVKLHFLGIPFLYFDLVYLLRSNFVDLVLNDGRIAAMLAATVLSIAGALTLSWRADSRPRRRPLVLAALTAPAVLLGTISYPAMARLDEFALISWNHKVATFFASSLHSKAELNVGTEGTGPVASAGPAGQRNASSAGFDALEASTSFTVLEDDAQKPDLIVVLQESTFDVRPYLERQDAALDGFYEPEPGEHGRLRVHTFGGGTWLAEFAFLTGIPHTEFGPNGSYAPFLMEGRLTDSLPFLLDRNGYETIAAYSSGGNFVNAQRFYTSIGIRHFLDAAELAQGESWNWQTPDSEILDAALRALYRIRPPADARPAFLMTLTLNQHGPHGATDRGRELAARFSAARLNGVDMAQYGEYLARLYESAEAFRAFKAEYRRLFPGRPAIFLHFGDHMPNIARQLLLEGIAGDVDKMNAHGLPRNALTTYYAMESSDFALQPSTLDGVEALDIAYLGLELVQRAGLAVDSTWRRRAMLGVDCGGLYADCNSGLKTELHRYLISNGIVKE